MPAKRPNILLVFADQHRYSALGSSGNAVIHTPNLDRLAGQGMVLDRAYSSCPICSPFRGQVLTGRYAHQNGVVDNEYQMRTDQPTLARLLKSAGYHTGFVGKWHLGYGPYTEEKRYGLDYLAANNCDHNYYKVEYFENETGPIKIDCWAPEEETSLAVRFMEEHQKQASDSPFFLMLGWGPPHWPYDQYPEQFDIYDPDEVDLPPNVPKQMEAFARQEIAHYYGNITGLDAQLGRVTSALDRMGVADDTIVLFSSDHGDHLSSHGYGKPMDTWMHHTMRASKATPYEESIHIPFIARFPGRIPGGTRSEALFSSVDVMPTVLRLCGLQTPTETQGADLSHVLLANAGPLSDSVYLQILGPGWPNNEKTRGKWVGFWRGVRTARWTYARWFGDMSGPWLFDCDADPYQMNNLAGEPEYSEIQAQLEARLRRWIAETGDPFETGDRDPRTGMLLLGQQFTHEKWVL